MANEIGYLLDKQDFGFATTQPQPTNIPLVQALIEPSNKKYITLVSELKAVSTTSTTLIEYPVTFACYVKQISILPSSNASTNNVVFTVNYGQNIVTGFSGNGASASVPINIPFTDGQYPKLQMGDTITLTAVASATGSYLQLAVILML